jgi:hypothetical protein
LLLVDFASSLALPVKVFTNSQATTIRRFPQILEIYFYFLFTLSNYMCCKFSLQNGDLLLLTNLVVDLFIVTASLFVFHTSFYLLDMYSEHWGGQHGESLEKTAVLYIIFTL